MQILRKIKKGGRNKGQSFVELALILPLILLMLAGMVEVAFGMFAYLTALDLTREAARFASTRDFRELNIEDPDDPTQIISGLHLDPLPYDPPPDDPSITDACKDDELHYFYDASCFFLDPELNPFLEFSGDKFDDVTFSIFTVADNHVTDRHPAADNGVWSLFDDNWAKDCDGNVVLTEPVFTNAEIEADFVANAPDDRGLVLVETFVCYDLILNIPFISGFIPSPYRIHTYTMMPAAEAIPTPTPIP
jgi:hypothetical protein